MRKFAPIEKAGMIVDVRIPAMKTGYRLGLRNKMVAPSRAEICRAGGVSDTVV